MKTGNELTPAQEKVVAKLANAIVYRQGKLASWLNHRSRKLCARAWMVLLVLFCALFGGYCLYLLVMGFG